MKLNGNYDYKNKKKKCIEYVSLIQLVWWTLVCARGAVLGDTLASILEEVGFDVTRVLYKWCRRTNKNLIETFAFHIEKNVINSKVIPEKLDPVT